MSGQALLHALELAETPALVRMLRRQRLPADVLPLIRIAAGDDSAVADAARRTGRSRAALRQASILYLQQVLFQPGADAYRTLGATSAATQEDLGQHMRWLMKWLHPDRDKGGWESAFAERVSIAWDSVKTPERRSAYDRAKPATGQPEPSHRRRRRPGPFLRLPRFAPEGRRRWGRVIGIAAGAIVALVVALGAATFLLPDGGADRLSGAAGAAPATSDAAAP